MNDFFGNVVASLNIGIPSEHITDVDVRIDDPIEKLLSTYSNHPSTKLINENVLKRNFTFKAVNVVDIGRKVRALHGNKSSMSGSSPPKHSERK